MQFLNNQQNKKDHPNENFAREVMELYDGKRKLHRKRYKKEVARAFMSWSFTPEGNFIMRPRLHDFGNKTLLGKLKFDGTEILKIILEQKLSPNTSPKEYINSLSMKNR
jgi:uncharacterized protein (DUF1800 family)